MKHYWPVINLALLSAVSEAGYLAIERSVAKNFTHSCWCYTLLSTKIYIIAVVALCSIKMNNGFSATTILFGQNEQKRTTESKGSPSRVTQ